MSCITDSLFKDSRHAPRHRYRPAARLRCRRRDGQRDGRRRLLNLTQAAVSQQLKRLEELFGTELFERHHKRLALKPNGERLIAHAQRLIALNDEVWGAMSAPAYAGEVRLGVPHDIVGTYMPPILSRFDKAWPRVRVALKCTTTPTAAGAAAARAAST